MYYIRQTLHSRIYPDFQEPIYHNLSRGRGRDFPLWKAEVTDHLTQVKDFKEALDSTTPSLPAHEDKHPRTLSVQGLTSSPHRVVVTTFPDMSIK